MKHMEKYYDYAKMFKALGDNSRLRIIKMLSQKNLCVCEIQAIIGYSMPTISNHLKILREAELITAQKQEKYVVYELSTSLVARQFMAYFHALTSPQWEADALHAMQVDRCTIKEKKNV